MTEADIDNCSVKEPDPGPMGAQYTSRYPWYDSSWLTSYVEAKEIIASACPEKLPEFVLAMQRLQAPEEFSTTKLNAVLGDDVLARAREIIANLSPDGMERNELLKFGRFVVHDHPAFNALQRDLTDMVSDRAGRALVPSYNFLSLYNNLGVCKVHMDAPEAMWTLDICIEQSATWPIHLSQRVPWPENFERQGVDWHRQIISDPDVRFQAYTLEENEAILFCGSNQWHYRDRIPRYSDNNYCHLLFMHFIPEGCEELVDPACWSDLFDIPALASAVFARPSAGTEVD